MSPGKQKLANRLSALERIHPPPVSTVEFLTRIQSASRLLGDAACELLVRELSDHDLDRIGADLEQIVFGDDRAAAEAFYLEISQGSHDRP